MYYSFKIIGEDLFFIRNDSDKKYQVDVKNNHRGEQVFEVFILEINPRKFAMPDAASLFKDVNDVAGVVASHKPMPKEVFRQRFRDASARFTT